MEVKMVGFLPNSKEANGLIIDLHHSIALWRTWFLLVKLLIPTHALTDHVIKILSGQLADERPMDIWQTSKER
jgi:hypothetical protein